MEINGDKKKQEIWKDPSKPLAIHYTIYSLPVTFGGGA